MCIVIDTCALHLVFLKKDCDFTPVNKWILKGKGKVVVGGSRYNNELKGARKYLPILAELSRLGKIVKVDDKSVDDCEIQIKKLESSASFNDPHIVALIRESGCKLLCSVDSSSDKYIRNTKFYSKGKRPSIYRSKKHINLLSDSNIVGACVET